MEKEGIFKTINHVILSRGSRLKGIKGNRESKVQREEKREGGQVEGKKEERKGMD